MSSHRLPVRPGAGDLSLVVAGHTNLDHFLWVDRLPAPDRTVPVGRRTTELGGTAANIARAACAYGVPTGLISRIGEDFPEEFLQKLASDGVDLRGMERVRPGRSPACYIVEDGAGAQMTFIDQGVMQDARNAAIPHALLAEARWVHLTTGDPPYMRALAEAARAAGQRVAFDPAQEIHYRWHARGVRSMLELSEILFGNRAEIDRVLRLLAMRRPADLLALVPTVVTTRGSKGAEGLTRSGVVRVPAPKLRRMDRVTGAGDAFRGGFYAAWFAGQPIRGCLVAGTRAGARWIETGGELRGNRSTTRGRAPA